MHEAVDLFAGPGGWDEGARELGLRPLGVELEPDACATREAAGHLTLRADVAELAPEPCRVLIGSPPCPTFSSSGDRDGLRVAELIARCARELGRGVDNRRSARLAAFDVLLPPITARLRARAGARRKPFREEMAHARAIKAAAMSLLVVEPLRWALTVRPEVVALEQVPAVLPLWRLIADVLRYHGWTTWAGVLNAADYGVPQTRERALLLASRVGRALPPHPTHCPGGALTIEGELQPWVTMAQALGWGMTERPALTLTAGGTDTGGAEPFGNGARASMAREQAAGRYIVRTRGEDGRSSDDFDGGDRPARTITGKSDSWRLNTGRDWKEGGDRSTAQQVPVTMPAPSVGGTSLVGWQLVSPEGAVERVTLAEAALLQTFPAEYPFQGTQSSQWRQVGNAVPPLLARHVLGALL